MNKFLLLLIAVSFTSLTSCGLLSLPLNLAEGVIKTAKRTTTNLSKTGANVLR